MEKGEEFKVAKIRERMCAMNTLNETFILIWFFPLLFIFHDFEEIIFVKPWVEKNKEDLRKKYPKLTQKLMPHFEGISTSAFALGVLEEFVLATFITIHAYLFNWYYAWIGAFIGFTLHLVVHCVQALVIRRYVPVLITSIICLPICCYIIFIFIKLNPMTGGQLMLSSSIAVLVIVANLIVMHKGMVIFDKWLAKFQSSKI